MCKQNANYYRGFLGRIAIYLLTKTMPLICSPKKGALKNLYLNDEKDSSIVAACASAVGL